MNNADLLRQGIIQDMNEGVITIGLDGVIGLVNPAAEQILGMQAEDLVGRSFALCFFEYAQNDTFNQTILDAIYHAGSSQRNIVPYYTGSVMRQLHVTTSYLHADGRRIGVIAVLNDISELSELRDAVKAMETIKGLNRQLELRNQLLSETFGRFLSDDIVRHLLETPDGLALGGKKCTLTVMMSDLRGFTSMSERMDPVSLLAMLNHYLGEMTDVIQSRNGTIIEFIGDGILAIFGAPVSSDRHADDAVAAAVEMQIRMGDINHWNACHGYPRLEMGIGISTGEMIVGNIGSEKRTKYGVVGSQVNLCGRIESYTVGGQVLISPRTRESVRAELTISQEQTVFPKGVQQGLLLSCVTGIGKPYSLDCSGQTELPAPLAKPLPLSFALLQGKHCSAEAQDGVFTAMNHRGAVLQTDADLNPFDNIRIYLGGDLFAKVIQREGEGWLLRFTSVPDGFSRILASVQ